MLWIKKIRYLEFVSLKMDSQINEGQHIKSIECENQNVCVEEETFIKEKDEPINIKEDILARNKFICSKALILAIFLAFTIIGFLDCLFNRQMMNKEDEIFGKKLLNSQAKIKASQSQQILSAKDESENLDKEEERLNLLIQSLESQVIQLKADLQQQRIKSIQRRQRQTNGSKGKDLVVSYRIRQNPRKTIPKDSFKDLYEFNIPINQVVQHSSLKVIYRNKNVSQGIQKQTFQRSIRLMEVTHNIDYQGHFVMDHFNFYFSPQKKYNALSQLLAQEQEHYEQKYQISKYMHEQIGMCIFVHSFNSAQNRLYLRNLDSIFQQNYQNYHLVYVNDASTDETEDLVAQYMQENKIPQSKYTLINNQNQLNYAANVYNAAHFDCQLGEIMVFLDGDDSFIGRQVLALLNAVYQKDKVALTYGSFLEVEDSKVTKGFSHDVLQNGQLRQTHTVLTSPLRTMYVDVVRSVKKTDLQDQKGIFYSIASEIALMTTAIQLVGNRLKFLQELIYEHRPPKNQKNDFIDEQRDVQNQVWKKQSSQKMSQMPFADNPKTVIYH